jgi:UDP-N-acetylmuramyl pentapeptide synthase
VGVALDLLESRAPGTRKVAVLGSMLELGARSEALHREVLEETGWHKKQAAEILGINPSTLYRKIKSFGLVAPDGADDADEADLEEIGA